MVTPPSRSADARRPLLWSSTALGAPDSDAAGVRLSWLGGFLQAPSARRFVQRAGDFAAAGGAVAGALGSWSVRDGSAFTWEYVADQAPWVALAGIWLLLLRLVSGARPAFAATDTATVVARAVVAGLALYLVSYFLAPRDLLPRLVVLNFLAFAAVATLVWRAACRQLFGADTRESPVAVVGAGEAARDLAALLGELAPHRKVLGLFPISGGGGTPSAGASLDDLRQIVNGRRVSALILAPEGPMDPDVLRTVVGARERDIEVVPMHAVYEQLLRRLPIRYQDPARVLEQLTDAKHAGRSLSWVAKRAGDIAGAGVGCALLLLSLPVLVPLIWRDVGRPIFFRQERLGLAGRPFRILKFRTMGPDAESDGPQWAETDDARASRFGRFLRRSRLDEWPQFWNVLLGEMSLVGPRPERPEFLADLVRRLPGYRERLLVRPGISGWAQVNYRYTDSVDGALDKLEYDLYYIKHRTFWLDAAIIGRTFWTVLSIGGR